MTTRIAVVTGANRGLGLHFVDQPHGTANSRSTDRGTRTGGEITHLVSFTDN